MVLGCKIWGAGNNKNKIRVRKVSDNIGKKLRQRAFMGKPDCT